MNVKTKIQNVDDLVEELGLDPSTPNLLDAVNKDGMAAEEAAEALYSKTNELAHILDPAVLPPENPSYMRYASGQ